MKIEEKNRNAEQQFARQGAVATQAKLVMQRKTENDKNQRDNTKSVAQNKAATKRQKTIFWQKFLYPWSYERGEK